VYWGSLLKNAMWLTGLMEPFSWSVYCLQCGARKAENPLTVREEIFQTIWVENAPDIFRIK
jgi:hypothetical protein